MAVTVSYQFDSFPKVTSCYRFPVAMSFASRHSENHHKGKTMKKTMFAVLAGFLAIGAGAAQAQTAGAPPYADTAPHAYVGIGVGAVKDTISDDHKRTTKIFGGYEFDQNWAVEAGYTYLGKTDFDFFSGDERLRGSMRSYTAYAAAKYTYPLTERSSVYGKLGLSHNARKVKSDTPGWNLTDSDNGLYAAAGVQTRLTEKVSLYAEYERNGKRVINGSKNHVLNAGVKFDF
jgi:OOP family OmpA-OmpF porin